MASKNPFERLNVIHDDDDDHVTTSSTKQQPLFQVTQEVKKKKKIRPEEKKKLEEEANQNTDQVQNDEGFSEVRKKAPRNMQNKFDEETEQEGFQRRDQANIKNKGAYHPRNNQRGRGGKRLFDRHSGTGRGKEISKEGAGSGTTWGNADQLAKVEAKGEYYEDEYYNYNDEDKYFDIAAKDSVVPTKVEEVKVEETVAPQNPTTTTPVETPTNQVDVAAERKARKDKKKKKKKGEEEPEEENKEAKVEVVDNSVSYKEYKELKSKTVNEAQKVVVRKEDPTLKPVTKTEVKDEFGFVTVGKTENKKKVSPKKKKEDALEKKINQIVSHNLIEKSNLTEKTDQGKKQDNYQPRPKAQGDQGGQGRYGGKPYSKKPFQGQQQQQSSGFTFNKEAFPEL